MVGVAQIEDKLRKNKLILFRHVWRKPSHAIVKKNDIIISSNDTKKKW